MHKIDVVVFAKSLFSSRFVCTAQWARYMVGGITHLNSLILLSPKLQGKISKISASDHWS